MFYQPKHFFSIHAVKNTFRDVTVDLLSRSKEDMAITSVAAEFARSASSQEWVHFFDVLLGKLSTFYTSRKNDFTRLFVTTC